MSTNASKLKVGYLPLGRVTFDMEAAKSICEDTRSVLAKSEIELLWNKRIITDPEDVGKAVDELIKTKMDILMIQTATFVDGQFAISVNAKWDGPLILWSVDEPSTEGRLRLNSLTGGNLLSNAFYGLKAKFKYIHGCPEDHQVIKKIMNYIKVISVLKYLNGGKLAIFGNYPAGYYPAEYDERALAGLFGVRIFQTPLNEIFNRASKINDDEANKVSERVAAEVEGVDQHSIQVSKFSKMYLTLRDLIKKNNYLGIAVECWPDFFETYGAAACGVVSKLCDDGIMAACEADLNGLITMVIEAQLANSPSYLGDMVRINKDNNSAIFWHCGAGACSLAGEKPKASVHPNRKQELIFDFKLKQGEVTIARLNKGISRHRLLITKGQAIIGNDNHFDGTSVEVKFEKDIDEVVNTLMQNGIEHHYAIVYGDYTDQLLELANQIGIETLRI